MKKPLKLFLGVFTLLWLLGVCSPSYGVLVDMFIKIGHFDGESQDPQFPDYSRVLACSHGLSRSNGVERVQMQDLSITKILDKSSPLLMQACAAATRLPSVTLVARRSEGNTNTVFLIYTFTDVIISSYSWGASQAMAFAKPAAAAKGLDEAKATLAVPTEQVSLNFAIMEMSYQQTDGQGAPVGTPVVGTVSVPLKR